MRLILHHGVTKKSAAQRLGCAEPALYAHLKDSTLIDEARELGPITDEPTPTEAPPIMAGQVAVSGGGASMALPPIGEEDPEAPSPEFMAQLCRAWAAVPQPDKLDHIAGWPEGTVQGWFDRERGDHGCAVRCAQLRRAAAVFLVQLTEGMVGTGNAKALRDILASRGALPEQAEAKGNAAEGHPLDAIREDLRKRLGAGGAA